MNCPISIVTLAAAWSLSIMPAALAADGEGLPAGFRFVGNYQFEKRVKIREGAPISVATKPFLCRVFTDGITVRVYGDEGMEGYTSFTIYRNDGVLTEPGKRIVETIPGVQAQTLVGNVLRQLTLTEQRMVLTRFPALSDLVEVTYANRIITLSRTE